jgi:hypothetical protein
MRRKLEIEGLSAEAASLQALLDGRAEDDDPIGVYQYTQRLTELLLEIDLLSAGDDKAASIALFFAGGPVTGSRGIRADFAGKAVEVFQDMVSKRFAAHEGPLGQRGRIPLRANSDLLLTEIARGSVGLLLEEAIDSVPIVDTQLKVVLDEVVDSIGTAANVDDAKFDELLDDVDNRFLKSLGEFFELLDDSDATIRLVEGDLDRQLDGDEIHRARLRTADADVEDSDDEEVVGTLYLLPAHRRFELRVAPDNVIWGLVASEFTTRHLDEVQGADDVVGRVWRARVRSRTIKRPNREPKVTYRLVGLIERIDHPDG